MSIESAQLFIERMKTDEAFAQGVMNCKNAQEREALVREAGFDFTGEEVRQCATELNDDELEGVSGGKYHYSCQTDSVGSCNATKSDIFGRQ